MGAASKRCSGAQGSGVDAVCLLAPCGGFGPWLHARLHVADSRLRAGPMRWPGLCALVRLVWGSEGRSQRRMHGDGCKSQNKVALPEIPG